MWNNHIRHLKILEQKCQVYRQDFLEQSWSNSVGILQPALVLQEVGSWVCEESFFVAWPWDHKLHPRGQYPCRDWCLSNWIDWPRPSQSNHQNHLQHPSERWAYCRHCLLTGRQLSWISPAHDGRILLVEEKTLDQMTGIWNQKIWLKIQFRSVCSWYKLVSHHQTILWIRFIIWIDS